MNGVSPSPIIEKNEGFMQRTPIYEVKLGAGFALTIVCLILSFTAYTKLQEISSDVYDITENWKTQPVTSVYVPASIEESCPDGFSVISLEKSNFPGISKGSCGCTPNAQGFVSSAANCSDAAEATNYCMSMPAQDEIQASKWRSTNICYKRDGEPAASWEGGFKRRPYPSSDGRCPEGYRKCGEGTDYEDGAVCFPDDTVCPITGMIITPYDQPPPLEGHWLPIGDLDEGNFTLFIRREFIGEMPIVDLELHLTDYSSSDYLDGISYDADNNKRGPCYTGSKQTFSDYSVKSDQVNLWEFSVSYPSACRKEDKRFTLFDRRDTQSHFLETLSRKSSDCAGQDLFALDDPRYTVLRDPDYVNSGVPCGNNGTTCLRDRAQLTNCADDICEVVINQNVCGLYARAVRSLAGSPQTFGMYRRGEITWRENCAVTRDAIYRNVDPLDAAVKAQLAGVVVSFVFGIVFGLLVPIIGLYVFSKQGSSKWRVHPDFEGILIMVDPYVHMCKLGPIVAAIVYISQIYRLYAAAGADNCSDATTNATFDYLGKTLPSIYQTSLANVLIECGLIVVAFYSAFQYKKAGTDTPVATAAPPSGCFAGCCWCGEHSVNKVAPAAELVPFTASKADFIGLPPVYGAPPPQGGWVAPTLLTDA